MYLYHEYWHQFFLEIAKQKQKKKNDHIHSMKSLIKHRQMERQPIMHNYISIG